MVEVSSGCLALITLRRAQVLRGLAEARSEREIADALSLTLAGVRSHVEDLKQITGERSTRELARWWQAHRQDWIEFLKREAGILATGL
jgi:DNA-binding NarL/FixJ family response regulator